VAKDHITKTIKNMNPDEFLSLLNACDTTQFSRLVSLGLSFTDDNTIAAVREILKPFGLDSDDSHEIFQAARLIAARSVALNRIQ